MVQNLCLSENATSEPGSRGQRVERRNKEQFLSTGSKNDSKRFPDAEERATLMSPPGKSNLPVVSKIVGGEEE